MTKEPKLDRARRILEEWEGLDSEVQIVREYFEKNPGRPLTPEDEFERSAAPTNPDSLDEKDEGQSTTNNLEVSSEKDEARDHDEL